MGCYDFPLLLPLFQYSSFQAISSNSIKLQGHRPVPRSLPCSTEICRSRAAESPDSLSDWVWATELIRAMQRCTWHFGECWTWIQYITLLYILWVHVYIVHYYTPGPAWPDIVPAEWANQVCLQVCWISLSLSASHSFTFLPSFIPTSSFWPFCSAVVMMRRESWALGP